MKMTGWKSDRVVYFGDHLFNDLKVTIKKILAGKILILKKRIQHIQKDGEQELLLKN